ncbi:MAG: MBL fold metallo-hydrolase [Oscillospiraceae bacterium]|nr:MBL fold metallo-hydrolase [Oscillospiraceae bacterium]
MENIVRLPLGALAANCYIIAAEDNSAVVVDPAASAEVEAFADNAGLNIGGIIITHGHFDHFAGAAALKAHTNAPIYAHELDLEMLGSDQKSWAWFMQGTEFVPVVPDKTFSDGDRFSVCGVEFRVMNAPGHTAGSCLLFCDSLEGFFAGDVLFKNGIGRTDGFSGSDRQMIETLRRISAIEGEYRVFTGHGEMTTLSREKLHNPYLRN